MFQSAAALPGFGTEIAVASRYTVLWGLFGKSRRLCRIFEAM